ncbi:MAG: phosphopyruvate hydratase [Selenomonadales bacterium]|nr:phosphopyruvate hydratase [Selenomonadales bacterium]
MTIVQDVFAREILDSRANPTVEVEVTLAGGVRSRASVPSGASTGTSEAVELRDEEHARYGGKGVLRAVQNVNRILRSHLVGQEAEDQLLIDSEMIRADGTANKGSLGANALLGVSLAVARAAASQAGIPLYRYIGGLRAGRLPIPMMNIFNGGQHADNNVDIQEYMIVPVGAMSFRQALRIGAEVYHTLRNVLKREGMATTVGDEGGYAPNLTSNEDALRYLMVAIDEAGYVAGRDVFLALDVAASEFCENGRYTFEGKRMTSDMLIDYYEELTKRYPIISVEDGLAEDDWHGWQAMTARLGGRIRLVGDDLFTTNPSRIARGIRERAGNALLVKPNQIGTLSETLYAIRLAESAGYSTIISHRSGETEDDFIADLAVAVSAPFIKTGAPARSERVAKYNRLLRIEDELGSMAEYAGKSVLANNR